MIERVAIAGDRRVSAEITGAGPDLVILHSLLTNRRSFDEVLDTLAGSYRVHLLDLPGFGDTTLVDRDILAYGRLVGDYLGELAEPAVVMGNGLGGFIALATAIAAPDRVARLVIVGAGPGFDDNQRQAFTGMAARAEEAGMAGVVEVAVRRIFSEAFLAEHPQHHEQRRAVLLETPVPAFRNACLALYSLDLRPHLATVAMPVLIVVGSEDQATPPAMARELQGLLPDARLIELPGVAHGPQIQEPGTFLAAVRSFLGLPDA